MCNTKMAQTSKYCCQFCQYETHKKSNYIRHMERKHVQTNPIVNDPMGVYQPSSYRHVQTQTNPLQVVNAPLTGNFQHPPTYKHVQTQTVGDHPATYRDLGTQTYTQQRELDTYSEASDVSSDDVNFKRDGNYRNAKKLINKAIKLMNTLVKTNVEWKHLIALMVKESYFQKNNKFELIEIMELVAQFNNKLQSFNLRHNNEGYNGNKKDSQESNFDLGSEMQMKFLVQQKISLSQVSRYN